MSRFYSHKELINKMTYLDLSFLTQIRIVVNMVSLVSILSFVFLELGSLIIFWMKESFYNFGVFVCS